MFKIHGWTDGIVDSVVGADNVGTESFDTPMTQGPLGTAPVPYFKNVNIVVQNGMYFATVYVCGAFDGSKEAQAFAIWLSTLKETDRLYLTVSSLIMNPPLSLLVAVMSALASTRARLTIMMDQIVVDNLAYFYLIADEVKPGTEGALYIPSYIAEQRGQDTSATWKAIHDFYAWVIEAAVLKKVLNDEEAARLNRGLHVVVPDDRFKPA